MKTFRVESYSGWFLVKAKNKRAAKSEGVKEYGRGRVTGVFVATDSDIKYFLAVKGEIGETP